MDEEDPWDLIEKDRALAKRYSKNQKIFDEALADFERQFDADLSKLEVTTDYLTDDMEKRVLYRVDSLVDTAVISNLDINVTGDFVHSIAWSEEGDIYCMLYLSVDNIDINYRNRSICKICERYKETLWRIEEGTDVWCSEDGEKLLSEISSAFDKYDTAISSLYDIRKKEWSGLDWGGRQYAWAMERPYGGRRRRR